MQTSQAIQSHCPDVVLTLQNPEAALHSVNGPSLYITIKEANGDVPQPSFGSRGYQRKDREDTEWPMQGKLVTDQFDTRVDDYIFKLCTRKDSTLS